ncbi:MAG: response regulator transcription factor [Rhodobacteraceae bacterium]|nr:response regulator transcription factor [Paracoccaceae bacterium]
MDQVTPNLMLIDDDAGLAGMLGEFLELHGFKVEVFHSAEAALSRVKNTPPDLVLLDVMLPGMNGFEALKQIRQTSDVPVIMLTARGEESDRIMGFMGGADDYLPKPFNPLELVVRAKAILKRVKGSSATPRQDAESLDVGLIKIDLRRREVFAGDTELHLTAAEFRVLEHLMRHANEVLSRAKLTELALQRPIEAYDRSIDTLISKLRRKLADANVASPTIRGLRGHGYVLDTAAGPADKPS